MTDFTVLPAMYNRSSHLNSFFTAGFRHKPGKDHPQKWIAMYPDGPEGWAEFRRTGYPKLFPVVSNSSNGTIDAKQIRRIPYPQSEYNNNRTGVQSGVGL